MKSSFIVADTDADIRDWTIGDLLAYAADAAPDSLALKQVPWELREAGAWTYGALLHDSRRLAGFLLDHFRTGEHLAIWASNSAQWVLYQLAAAQAGLTLVTLNPALKEREICSLLERSRAAGLIVEPHYRGVDLAALIESLRPHLPELRTVLRTNDWRDHLAAAPAVLQSVAVSPSQPALLLYTSGTTGRPKGVLLSHRGVVNNAILGSERFGIDLGQVWLGTLPSFHVGGSVYTTLSCIYRLGAHVVVPSFDAARVLDLIESERPAWIPVVPPMVIGMIEHESFERRDLSSVQVLSTGGTTITPEFVRLMRDRFGADVQVMFGQTEAGGGICKTFRTDTNETIAATVGRPYPHTALRIADVHTGDTTPVGTAGEILIRSPFMTDGYFEDPEANAAAFDNEGFLHTGDVGIVGDDGYVRITGRLKEMIIRGGENIYPREIEDVIGEYPGVVEAAVVGVPDDRWGEEVAIAIRCEVGADVDVEAMRAFLQDRIARHKVPKLWKIAEDFPRTPSAKIQKFEVARWFTDAASEVAASSVEHKSA